jgi:hypothetical protein
VLRIRIRKDPHNLSGSGILDADPEDPDPRLQNWHLITFLVQKSIVNKLKYIYANFSVHTSYSYSPFLSKKILLQNFI